MVAHGDLNALLVGEAGKLYLPQPDPGAVVAPAVGADHQAGGTGVDGRPDTEPPAPDRLDSKRGGVVILADADPPGVLRDVVDAVGDRLAERGVCEVMDPHLDRLPDGLPFPAGILEVPDELLLLGVHRDHRVPGVEEGLDLLVEVVELGIPVGVGATLSGLDVGLQVVAEPLPQIPDYRMADGMALPGQRLGELAGALGAPQQGGLRVATRGWADQSIESPHQPRVGLRERFATPSGPADRGGDGDTSIQLLHRLGDCGTRRPGGLGYPGDPSPPQSPRLHAEHDSTLAFVEMRQDRGELLGQALNVDSHQSII